MSKLGFIDEDAKKATEECDCTDTTQGVFKADAFFFWTTYSYHMLSAGVAISTIPPLLEMPGIPVIGNSTKL